MRRSLERYTFAFYGSQLGMPLLEDSGHAIEPLAAQHPWEQHRGVELAMVIKGKFVFEVGSQREIAVPGGHLSVKKPGELHRGKQGIFFPCNMYWFLYRPLAAKSTRHTPYSLSHLQSIFKVFGTAGKPVARMSPLLCQLLEQYGTALTAWRAVTPHPKAQPQQLAKCDPASVAWLRTLVCGITIEASRCFSVAAHTPHSPCVLDAQRYMNDHFQDEIKITDVVKHLNVSEAYLYKVFEAEIGQTPNGYLQTLRLEKACQLLAEPGRSITDIAFEAGFSSSQYFTKAFRAYCGHTPKEFAQRMKRP